MKTLDGFCQFMEEYMDEAVYSRGGKTSRERLHTASDKAFQRSNDAEGYALGKETHSSTSASQNLKDRAYFTNAQRAAAKATGKINDLGNNADINAERR